MEWYNIFSFDGIKHIKIMFLVCFILRFFIKGKNSNYIYLFAICVGFGKEFFDLYFRTGFFEIKDILANCFGIGLAYIVNLLHLVIDKKE